jgi:guanosine-3',5'-bis(diphosphate) 3'-pyrophosphohydrolase
MKRGSDIRKALELAIHSHDGQIRKFSGVEYIWHPVNVAKIVREVKKSKNKEKIIIAALLHDTVEDTNLTINEINSKFGEMVSNIVSELTSDLEKINEIGKSEYLLEKMLKMTSYALVIKLADRLHNCSDLASGSQKFRDRYVTETRFILKGLNNRYLSNTHKKLIGMIDKEISKFE